MNVADVSVQWVRVSGPRLVLVVTLGLSACAPPAPHPEIPAAESVIAAEATFGDTLCRRIDAPSALTALVDFLAATDTGWQPFWGDPIEPQVKVELLGEAGTGTSFGLADAQFLARVDDAPAFRAASESEARRFIELLGGVPVGQPENPCH